MSRIFTSSASLMLVTLSLAGVPGGLRSAESPPPEKGRVTHVTLYQGQALIARTLEVAEGKGAMELVVAELPESIVPESLFAEGSDGLQVRAVRFRSRAVGEEPREEVRTLDLAIEALKDRLEANQRGREALAKKLAYIEKLEGFVATTAGSDISRGVLDSEALEKLSLFAFAEREKALEQDLALGKEAKVIAKEAELLDRKRAETAARSSRTLREALVFMEKTAAGPATLRLNYLVSNCGWSPNYVFRALSNDKEVRLEYNALIQQVTGEDWDRVELTLSTASPALSASGPGLAPFTVTLESGTVPQMAQQQVQVAQPDASELGNQVRSIKQRQVKAIADNRAAMNYDQNLGSSWEVNSAANDFQCLELLGGKEVLGVMRLEEDGAGDGPSLAYSLAGPVSIASRSDQQMVRVLQTSLPSRLYYVATPVLSLHVYREAEISNTCGQDLLGGVVNAYLDGRFVGRAEIPTVTRGQDFVVGFGADPQLRTRRELVSKTETVQGGNKELALRYSLAVENYKDVPASVRIFDRLPYTGRVGDLRVTLKDPTVPLSENKIYQRRERPKGILRWDVEVPAAATGDTAKAVEYGYLVEYDRKFQVSTGSAAALPAAQQEFQELQKARVFNK